MIQATSGLRLGLGCAPLGNLFAAVPEPQAQALLPLEAPTP
jgi:hypothetical protein